MSDGPIQATMQKQMSLQFDDLPYLGEPIMRKEDDPEQDQPQAVQVVGVQVFRLWKEEDRQELERILQMTACATTQLYEMDRQYVDAKENFVVYLHWSDYYMANPTIAKDIHLIRRAAGASKLPDQCAEVPVAVVGTPTKDKK